MVVVLRSEHWASHASIENKARPWEARGSIDVEALAAWAYGVQMVDRFERSGLHAIEAEAAGYEVSHYSSDGVGQLMQIEHLGCRIDRGSSLVADTVHPAALAVASAVEGLDDARRHMVRVHARSGTRPGQWREPDVKVRAAVWVKEGEQAQVEYLGPGRHRPYCQVIMLWDEKRRDWGREQYATWWEGLSDLAWRLSTRALGFTVTGPVAPPEPWLEKRAEPSSISLDDGAEGTPLAGPPGGPSEQ